MTYEEAKAKKDGLTYTTYEMKGSTYTPIVVPEIKEEMEAFLSAYRINQETLPTLFSSDAKFMVVGVPADKIQLLRPILFIDYGIE